MNAKLNTIIALLVALVAALAIVSVSDSSDASSDYQVDISVPHDGPEYYAKVSFEFSEDYQSFYLHLNLNKGYMTSIEGLKITMYVNGDEHSIECINMPPPEFPVDYSYGVLDYMSDISEYHVPIHIEVFVDGIETAPFAIEQVLPAEVTTTAPASAKYKDGVNFTVDSTGYQNVVVTVKSKDPAVPFDVVLTPAGGVYSFNMPKSDVVITVSAEPCIYDIIQVLPEAVTTTAPGSAAYLSEVTFTVDATGYENVVVDVDGEILSAVGGKYSFTMPAHDVTLTVTADPIVYNIYQELPEAVTTTAPATAPYLEDVTFTVDATGYKDLVVFVSGFVIIPDAKGVYEFTMPAHDVTIVVNAVPIVYNIYQNLPEAVTTTAPASAAYLSEVTFTVDATGYENVVVDVDGEILTATAGVYKFTMPAHDVTITVTADPIVYNIDQTVPEAVTTTAPATAPYLDDVTFTVDAPGYKDIVVTVDGVVITPDAKGVYEFTMPAHDVALVVTGTPIIYNIYQDLCTGVTTTAPGSAAYLSEVSFQVIVDRNYELTDDYAVFVDGEELEMIPGTHLGYEFTMPAHDVTITVVGVEPKTFNIYQDLSKVPAGSVVIDAPATAKYTTTVDFTVTLADEYQATADFAVMIDGVVITGIGSAYSFEMPAHDVTISVVGVEPKYYRVFQHELPAGVVTDLDTVYDPQIGLDVSYKQYTTEVAFVVSFLEGYEPGDDFKMFENYGTEIPYRIVDGKYWFFMPSHDVSLTATGVKFTEYNIYQDLCTGVTTNAPATAPYTSTVEFVVSPVPGYDISNIVVAVDGEILTAGAAGAYSFVMPNHDVTITVTGAVPAPFAIRQNLCEGVHTTAPGGAKYLEVVDFQVIVEKGYDASNMAVTVIDNDGNTVALSYIAGTLYGYRFTMPANDVTIIVDGVVPATYNVFDDVSACPAGSVTVNHPATADFMSNVAFTIDVAVGYDATNMTVKVVDVDGNVVALTGYGFKMPASDVTIVVEGVVPATYNVFDDVSACPAGSVTVNHPATADYKTTVSYTVDVAVGYDASNMTVTVFDSEGNVVSTDYRFTMPASDVTIVVEGVVPATYNVDCDVSACPADSVVVNHPETADYLTTVEFEVVVAVGYDATNMTVKVIDETGASVALTGYKFTMPASDVTIVVEGIVPATYNVFDDVSACPAGSVTVNHPATADYKSNVAFTIDVAAGYDATNMTVTVLDAAGAPVALAGYGFVMPASDVTIVVEGVVPATYNIYCDVSACPADSVTVEHPETAVFQETFTFDVVIAEGYNGKNMVVTIDGEVIDPYTYTMPAHDVTIVVTGVEPNRYHIYQVFVDGIITNDLPSEADYKEGIFFTLIELEGYYGNPIVKIGPTSDPSTQYGNYVHYRDGVYDFEMPAYDVNVYVTNVFPIPYLISKDPCVGVTIDAPEKAPYTTNVAFDVTVEPGYDASNMTVTVIIDKTGESVPLNGYEFTMPHYDVTIVVDGVVPFSYNVNKDLPVGIDVPTVPTTVPYTNTFAFQFVLDDGYMVTEDFTVFVTGADGTSVAVSAIPGTYLGYEFVMPAQDVTITATGIDTRTYAIYQDVVDGAATTAPESAKYLDTVTFDVVLENGFVASEDFKVVVDGKELVGTGMTFTFEMPAHDVTIVVDGVVPATYTITAIDGDGYHITAPATAQYKSFVDFDVEIFNGYQSTSEYVVYVNGYPAAAIYGDVIEYFGYFFGENYFYGFEMPAEDVLITVEGVVPAPLVLIIIDSIDNDYIGGNYTTAHVFEVEVGHSFKTADSYREGKSFGGYYADESLTVPVDITAPMTVSIVSFVKWLDVFTVEINGDEVLVGEGDSLRSVLTPFQQEAFVFTEAGVAYDLDAPVTSNLVLDAEFISAGDEVYWYVTDDCKTLIVLGNGDMYDYTKTESAPWAVFNSTIQNVFILGDASEYDTVADLLFEFGLVTGAEYLVVADILESYADAGFTGITTIGQFAFHAMKIKNLYIGDSVVTISKYAFNKVVAFTNVVFGAGVKNIGKWAFSVNFYMYNDDGTVSIDNVITAETRGPNTSSTQSIFMLSKGVNTAIVNNLAFTKCGSYALVATDVVGISGDAIWEIGVSPVEEEYFGVLSIYGGDMADSKNYASVPWYNYMQCFNKVVIYDGVAHVDKYAFYNYDNIDSFTFSGDLTNVGKYSFYGMTFQGEAAKDAKLAGHDYVKVAAGTYVLA